VDLVLWQLYQVRAADLDDELVDRLAPAGSDSARMIALSNVVMAEPPREWSGVPVARSN
jgi:hypothetical protein